ncbi:MAG: hypothetical protein ABI557_13550, partial [Aureliella sp.]
MSALNRIRGATLVLVIALTTISNAMAGHPHWGGGWYGHGHHWRGGYGHYHGYGSYGSLGIYGPNVWGVGYGWGGYSGLGYQSWYTRPFGYSSYYANYYVPRVTYYAPSPTYYVPSATYYVPDYVPSVNVPSVIDYAPDCCVPSCCDDCLSNSQSSIDNWPSLVTAGTVTYSVPARAPADASVALTIPASLLASADAIFQAGGYRQAATAYAQLNVRYGSSDQIFARRFVAQVACGDFDQAAVVLASAQGAGFPIER